MLGSHDYMLMIHRDCIATATDSEEAAGAAGAVSEEAVAAVVRATGSHTMALIPDGVWCNNLLNNIQQVLESLEVKAQDALASVLPVA